MPRPRSGRRGASPVDGGRPVGDAEPRSRAPPQPPCARPSGTGRGSSVGRDRGQSGARRGIVPDGSGQITPPHDRVSGPHGLWATPETPPPRAATAMTIAAITSAVTPRLTVTVRRHHGRCRCPGGGATGVGASGARCKGRIWAQARDESLAAFRCEGRTSVPVVPRAWLY